MPTREEAEGTKHQRRLYHALRILSEAAAPPQDMRIVKIWPATHWEAVWQKLATTPSAESDIVNCYKVIKVNIPTNERLHRIKIVATDRCNECGRKGTLCHRLNECGEGQETWTRTKIILSRVLRASPMQIPDNWLLRPSFLIWPPQLHRAVLWVLSRYVYFRAHYQPALTANELMDFYRRSRWKLYQTPRRRNQVANYLTVIDDAWIGNREQVKKCKHESRVAIHEQQSPIP